MKRLISLLLGFIPLLMFADPSWKVHTTFDEAVTRIIDTGKSVYFTSRTQPYTPGSKYNSIEYLSLFRYDKDSDEVLNLSSDNLLSSNIVSTLEYSPEKGMLVVVSTNNDIDLLYDNGKAESISAYRHANVGYDKTVNSVYIDAANDRVYLSTPFGYVALNTKKLEVAESRIYGVPVSAMARIGDHMLLLQGDRLLTVDIKSPRLNIDDYEEVATLKSASALIPLSDDVCLVKWEGGSPSTLSKVTLKDGVPTVDPVMNGRFYNPEHNTQGVTIPSGDRLFQFSADGSYKYIERERDDWSKDAVASHDMIEIWHGHARKGIWSKKYSAEGSDNWTLTRDCIRPNAPAPYQASRMVWHPQRGLLVVNHGFDPCFSNSLKGGPILLSAYKDGMWTNLSPVYTTPEAREAVQNPNGLAVDPDNPDLVYFGSLMYGLERINMADGYDVIHLSKRNDPSNNLPGFVQLVEGMQPVVSPIPGFGKIWDAQCPFSAPKFDYYGNLWTSYADYENQTPFRLHLYCWEAADRKATTDASNIILPKKVEVPGEYPYNRDLVVPLLTSRHRNLLVYSRRSWDGPILLIDTGGTPTDASDDKTYSIDSFIDQDGNQFDVYEVTFLWEDPDSGLVWVGHRAGVFYFNPDNVIAGNNRVTRIKVARNDGTNLADYLLDEVPVNGIATDGRGKKWFATSGAGVICTSSDGRTIEESFTTENSPLPDDITYGFGYIPTTNSMMIATASGLAEYFLPGAATKEAEESVKIYPNPVRPEYGGYVNIEGLPDNALVKIVDASGNLVKELGVVNGGSGRWDATNLAFKRVSSGVYFVLCSSAETDGTYANVGKVLVVN